MIDLDLDFGFGFGFGIDSDNPVTHVVVVVGWKVSIGPSLKGKEAIIHAAKYDCCEI